MSHLLGIGRSCRRGMDADAGAAQESGGGALRAMAGGIGEVSGSICMAGELARAAELARAPVAGGAPWVDTISDPFASPAALPHAATATSACVPLAAALWIIWRADWRWGSAGGRAAGGGRARRSAVRDLWRSACRFRP